jgi:hypothetical protein
MQLNLFIYVYMDIYISILKNTQFYEITLYACIFERKFTNMYAYFYNLLQLISQHTYYWTCLIYIVYNHTFFLLMLFAFFWFATNATQFLHHNHNKFYFD